MVSTKGKASNSGNVGITKKHAQKKSITKEKSKGGKIDPEYPPVALNRQRGDPFRERKGNVLYF